MTIAGMAAAVLLPVSGVALATASEAGATSPFHVTSASFQFSYSGSGSSTASCGSSATTAYAGTPPTTSTTVTSSCTTGGTTLTGTLGAPTAASLVLNSGTVFSHAGTNLTLGNVSFKINFGIGTTTKCTVTLSGNTLGWQTGGTYSRSGLTTTTSTVTPHAGGKCKKLQTLLHKPGAAATATVVMSSKA